jgi:hypothetical protein
MAALWIKKSVSPEALVPEAWVSLNLAERGLLESVARVLILFGPIADDPLIVARRVGADVAEVEAAWPKVRQQLVPDESGKLVHAETMAAIRAAEEACANIRETRANAGHASGEARRSRKQTGTNPEQNRTNREQTGTHAEQTGTNPNKARTDKDLDLEEEEKHTTAREHGVAVVIRNSQAPISEWETFKKLYPAHRLDEEAACRAFVSREEEAGAILTGLRAAVKSEDWTKEGGRFVPKASKFIGEGLYKNAARVQPEANRAPGLNPDGSVKPGWSPDGKIKYFDPGFITGERRAA